MSAKLLDLARRIHRTTEIALWAMLSTFVIYFAVFILPKIPEIQAERAIIRTQEISAENAWLCEKLSIKHGTDRYDQCLLDVGQFRWKVEKRIYEETDPFAGL